MIETFIPSISVNKPGNVYLNIKVHKPFPRAGCLITTGYGSYIENISALDHETLLHKLHHFGIRGTAHSLLNLILPTEVNILKF